MKNKEKYISPQIETEYYESVDVLTASGEHLEHGDTVHDEP